MKISEIKSVQRIKRSADQIFSHKDIPLSDNDLLLASQKIFYTYIKDELKSGDQSLYTTRTYNHPLYPNIKVSPHFIRDDGVVIYLEIIQNDVKLQHTRKGLIHVSMDILKVKTALVFTIELKDRINTKTLHQENIRKLSNSYDNIECNRIKYSSKIAKEFLDSQQKKKFKKSPNTEPNKNKIITGFIPDQWVAASKTRNYAINDTLVDWLNIYGEGKNNTKSPKIFDNHDVSDEESMDLSDVEDNIIIEEEPTACNDFNKYIMQKGCQFEKHVIELIKDKVKPKEFVTICANMDNFHQKALRYEEKTISEIKKGTPIIYQPVLFNRTGILAYSYGIPDLLVRSDYLDCVTDTNPYDKFRQKLGAPELGKKYHYVVIDIKFTTLELCSDGERIRNNGNFPAYKCQLYVYNHALGQIQGYEPGSAFILGRKYKYDVNGIAHKGSGCFDRLGHIKYDSWDNTCIDDTLGAIKWIKKLRTEGSKWKLYPKPSREELYPNMCVQTDNHWSSFKEKYAKDIGEITLLWNCGPINRTIGHQNGVYSFKDEDCSSDSVGVKGVIRGPILDKIIKINRKKRFKSVLDKIKLKINPYVDNSWMDDNSDLRISVDFETINNVFDDFKNLPYSSNMLYIILIGISYKIKGGKELQHKRFLLSDLSMKAEKKVITDFYKFIRKLTDKHLGKDQDIPMLYHWGHIERTLFSKICKDVSREDLCKKIKFYDLGLCFKKNPIVINGCFKFGIKEIGKRLHKLGLIKTNWNKENPCYSGNTAMLLAHKAYTQKNIEPISKNIHIKNIIEYNKVDCIAIHEIVDLLLKVYQKNL
jgi:hypothetical protein